MEQVGPVASLATVVLGMDFVMDKIVIFWPLLYAFSLKG